MSKFCQNCGSMLDDTAAFCGNCGKPVEAHDAQAAAPRYTAPAAPQYEAPAVPQYEAPAVPQYEAPAVPQYEAPAAPQYEAPAAPRYEAPAAPQYGAPQYGTPQQYGAPQYGTPQQYGAPQYGTPQQYAAPQYAAPQYGAPQYGAPAPAQKKGFMQIVKEKKIFFIGGVVLIALAVALVLILGGLGGNSAEGALKNAFEKVKVLDIKGVYDATYEYHFDSSMSDEDRKEAIKDVEDEMNENKEMVTLVKNMLKDAKLTVKKDEKVSDEELKKLKESWSSSYKDTDKITEIHKLDYEISGLMGSSSEDSCYAVKVGGKWYVKDFSDSMSGLGI